MDVIPGYLFVIVLAVAIGGILLYMSKQDNKREKEFVEHDNIPYDPHVSTHDRVVTSPEDWEKYKKELEVDTFYLHVNHSGDPAKYPVHVYTYRKNGQIGYYHYEHEFHYEDEI